MEGSTYAEACHQHEFEHAWAEADRHQRGALDEREFQSFLLAVDRFAAAAAAPEPAPATVPALPSVQKRGKTVRTHPYSFQGSVSPCTWL